MAALDVRAVGALGLVGLAGGQEAAAAPMAVAPASASRCRRPVQLASLHWLLYLSKLQLPS